MPFTDVSMKTITPEKKRPDIMGGVETMDNSTYFNRMAIYNLFLADQEYDELRDREIRLGRLVELKPAAL